MISTDFNGDTVFVLNDSWNGQSDFQLEATLVRDTQTGLTQRESRRACAETISCKARYEVTVRDDDLRTLQGALRRLNTQSVILPLWPAITRWAGRAAAPIGGGLMIVWKSDWSQYSIYAAGDAEPGWPAADDNWAPALKGFINRTSPQLLTPDAALWNIEFTESSRAIYALDPADLVLADGPQPAGYTAAPKLLPFQPDFKTVSENISVEIDREAIGFKREIDQTFYQHAASRSNISSYTLKNEEPGELLRFLIDVAGPGEVFWARGWFELARLTADVHAADTILNVEGSQAAAIGDYIAIGEVLRKITDSDAETITIDVAAGAELPARSTLVLPLCLARLESPTVTLNWRAPGFAKCDLRWTELPTEVLVPEDETLNTTIGRLPTRVILFHFYRDLRNGTILNWYFTSFERDLTWNEQDWLSSSFNHGDISRTLNLEDAGVEITSFKFDGNPLIEDVLLRAEAPLNVRIYHGELGEPAPLAGEGGEGILGEAGEPILGE